MPESGDVHARAGVRVVTEYVSDTERYLSELLEPIQSALAAYAAGEYASEMRSFDVKGVRTGPYSTVAFLAVRWGTRTQRLVAKTIARHPHNERLIEQENQAVVEFEALKRFYASFQGIEGCSVPRPVLTLPEIDTYIMEFVEGDLLDGHLKYLRRLSSPTGFRTLVNRYLLCGRWLKHLQHVTGSRSADDRALEWTVEQCDELLDRIREINGGAYPCNLRDRVNRNLDRQLSKLNNVEILLSGCHGDFGPWNILATADGITVFDFFGFAQRPIPSDLLRVLVHLEDERQCLTSSSSRIDALRSSFLAGYGGLPKSPEPLLLVCETLPRLTSLLHAYLFKDSGRLHDRVQRRRLIKEHLAWLTDETRQRSLLSIP